MVLITLLRKINVVLITLKLTTLTVARSKRSPWVPHHAARAVRPAVHSQNSSATSMDMCGMCRCKGRSLSFVPSNSVNGSMFTTS